MFSGEIHNLRDLCFSHLISENAALTDAVVMDMKHDPRCVFPALVEEPFNHVDDKLHGSVVIVQQQHPVQTWPFHPRLRLGYSDRSAITTVVRIVAATHSYLVTPHV